MRAASGEFPLVGEEKDLRTYRAEEPPERPRHPNAHRTEGRGERKGESDAHDEVYHSCYHELPHFLSTFQHSVGDDFQRANEIAGGDYPHKRMPDVYSLRIFGVEEEEHDLGTCGHIHDKEYRRNAEGEQERRFHAVFYAVHFVRAEVLSGVVGHTVRYGDDGYDCEVVEFYCRGVARYRACAETVDKPLDRYIAKGYAALLQRARHADKHKLFESGYGEKFEFSLAFHLSQREDEGDERGDATRSLADERRPGNACDAHMEFGDEQHVHADIRKRRYDEEYERRTAKTPVVRLYKNRKMSPPV